MTYDPILIVEVAKKLKERLESPEGKLALERAEANTRAAMKKLREASRLRPEILLKRYTDLT